MPVSAMARIFGTVSAAQAPVVLAGVFEGLDAHLEGTVTQSALSAESGRATAFGLEIWLGDHWVEPRHLVAPFEIEDSIDSHTVQFSFGLTGSRYGVLATAATWTRTPVEVWATVSRPGGPERRFLRAAGYVLTCEQTGGYEPGVRVSCGDPSILFDRAELCHEVAPGSGLTRGQIAAELCADVGITLTDIPPGAVYDKPVITDSRRLFEFLKNFGEPEGWSWRFRPEDGYLEAYVTDLAEEPIEPDRVWTEGDFITLRTTPPSAAPSRYVVRGTRAVIVQESGIKTTLNTTEIVGPYAPRVAVSRQLSDGTLVPSGFAQPAELDLVVKKVEDVTEERGGKVIRHTTREWGWTNPAAARLRTPDASEGPGPVEDGFYYCEAYLDEEENCVAWPRERFLLVGERRETPVYDGDTVMESRTEVFRLFRRPMGVRNVGSAAPNVIGAGIGSDDQSYRVVNTIPAAVRILEEFGRAESHTVRYTYNGEGAAEREVQETRAYRSPRVAVEANPWYLRYDGQGQKDLVTQWGLTERRKVANFLRGGHLAGKEEDVEAFHVAKRLGGSYDWGDFRSNAVEATFRRVRRERTSYNVLSEHFYEEVPEDEEGRRVPRLIQGRAPMPRYRGSAWTVLAQQPTEILADDPVLAEWFGAAPEVVQHEFLQDLDEAARLLLRRRRRRLAFVHDITAPWSSVRPGDTVLLISPSSGIHHRCLVSRRRESWTLGPVTSVQGTYTLEQPL